MMQAALNTEQKRRWQSPRTFNIQDTITRQACQHGGGLVYIIADGSVDMTADSAEAQALVAVAQSDDPATWYGGKRGIIPDLDWRDIFWTARAFFGHRTYYTTHGRVLAFLGECEERAT